MAGRACVVGGVCMARGVHGRGGVCVAGGACIAGCIHGGDVHGRGT